MLFLRFLCDFFRFWDHFWPFLFLESNFEPKNPPKRAENDPLMTGKIFFIKVPIFKNFFVIFSGFFWPFLTIFDFEPDFEPKNHRKRAKNDPLKTGKYFLWKYLFLRIFCDFYRFFWPFLTIFDFEPDFEPKNHPKRAKNDPFKTGKIFFIKVSIFKNFLWFFQIFLTIFHHFWFWARFWAQIAQNGPKNDFLGKKKI